jgi:transposase
MKTYLGIDLHKRSSTWILIDENKKVIDERTVPCTPLNVRQALHHLPLTKDTQTQVAVEPVCGWRWFTHELEEYGMDVHLANPLKVRMIADSKLKTDKIDAKILALLLKADFLPESYKASDDTAVLRNTVRHRGYLVRQRTSIKNRIHSICTREGSHLTTLTPLTKDGLKILQEGHNEELKDLVVLMNEVSTHIDTIEKQMKTMSKLPTVQLLMTMPGVGLISAIAIHGEVGDWSRFDTPEKLASYSGLVPSQRSSGASVRMGHITKTGSHVLRYTMVESAMKVRNCESHEQLYSFYERVVPFRGAMRARTALARKMLTILWHMVHNNTPYENRATTSTQSEMISCL